MDSTTVMWLILGASCLVIGTMMVVSGLILVTAESMQRTMAVIFGVLLGVMGGFLMVYLALPRVTMATYHGVFWGSIAIGVVTAALLGWKRMAG